jgi:hypothetical protein
VFYPMTWFEMSLPKLLLNFYCHCSGIMRQDLGPCAMAHVYSPSFLGDDKEHSSMPA